MTPRACTSSAGCESSPRRCWGEAYMGVLAQRTSEGVVQLTPEAVAILASSSAWRAWVSLMPKSVILSVPFLPTSTLAGFMSRWMTFRDNSLWQWPNVSARMPMFLTARAARTARSLGQVPTSCPRSPPGMYSYCSQGVSPSR